MSDKIRPIEFEDLVSRIFSEYLNQRSIFGIPEQKFFFRKRPTAPNLFNGQIDTPLGPAAGPHSQMAPNIISAYLSGGRFFELKTVQMLDKLIIDKPCIDAEDEAYNVEWSQELTLGASFAEYLKAWFLIHLLNGIFGFSNTAERGFVFNMSVGYDLAGIKSPKMDRFIEGLKDASKNVLFNKYRQFLRSKPVKTDIMRFIKAAAINEDAIKRTEFQIENIVPQISESVTLSTMHGCPPQEIEAIAKYLLREKGLHTFIKLNPTLLGFMRVREIFQTLCLDESVLDEGSFEHDLQFSDAVPMLKRLQEFAAVNKRSFGVKLSNTLGVNNFRQKLPGSQMYMSGRTLFPLTINLAYKLVPALGSDINISFSGGASAHNIADILRTGIYPVTMATELLKPGGYSRLLQLAGIYEELEPDEKFLSGGINSGRLKALAERSLSDPQYNKNSKIFHSVKQARHLPKFDCYISPCSTACPIHQDVTSYIRLVEEERYEEAFKVIVSANPLPFITSYICDHKCMDNCTRCEYDSSVRIRELKKIAAEKGRAEYLKRLSRGKNHPAANGIKAAIIGAGPAGLSAAYFLANAGFDVHVFEQYPNAGGTVQRYIPGFRIPQSAIEKDVDFISRHGVNFKFNSDPDFSISKLKDEGFRYIFLAIGASRAKTFSMKEGKASYDALEFLRMFNRKTLPPPGPVVAVTGGGNSAFDAARAAIRSEGVKKVYIIYRRTKELMPADKEEYEAAIGDGVILRELLLPEELHGKTLKCRKMTLSKPVPGVRREAIPTEEFEYMEIDTLISAIGESVDTRVLFDNGIMTSAEGTLNADNANETSVENVFIGGDALRGPSTVVEAIADGRKTADEIIRRESLSFENKHHIVFDQNKRYSDIIVRKGNISSTEQFEARQEAARCLNCSFICNQCVEVCPNRANIAIKPFHYYDDFRNQYQILHLDALCNECGNCETFCPYEGSPYKNKITLFNDEKDFDKSLNEGFCIIKNKNQSELKIKVRYLSETGTIILDKSNTIIYSSIQNQIKDKTFNLFIEFIFIILENYRYLLPKAAN
ncbi:MAG: putative selenate reductase subunit YgfK [Ignavibacteriales bacterium]